MKVLKWIGGFVLGLVVAMALVTGVEVVNGILHPPPAGFQGTHEEVCTLVESYPAWLLVTSGVAWAFTAFLGTWIAKRIGGRGAGLTVGLLLLAGAVYNVLVYPYPLWFKGGVLVGMVVGVLVGSRKRAAAPAAAGVPTPPAG
ncbi:hypothetical protein PHYC_02857 [Phycisphaerales bacterium]|nr:hypothetical protein PHYC_02857 [Phycisphaerales bacterium]